MVIQSTSYLEQPSQNLWQALANFSHYYWAANSRALICRQDTYSCKVSTKFQFCFCLKHRTELLGLGFNMIRECLLMLGNVQSWCCLTHSAAFDTASLSILLSRLEQCCHWSLCLLIYSADMWCTPGFKPWSYYFVTVYFTPWFLN